jgi:hypothetical protein
MSTTTNSTKPNAAMALPESQKLINRGYGRTNIIQFKKNFITHAKSIWGDDANILITGDYPDEWIVPWLMPETLPTGAFALDILKSERLEAIKEMKRGKKVMSQIGAALRMSITKSSEDHIKKYHKGDFERFCDEDRPIELFRLIETTHTFVGKTSGYDDKDEVRTEFVTFRWNKSETLPELFERMNDLCVKVDSVGLTDEVDGKRRCHQLLKSISEYKPKEAVNDRVIQYMAVVNKDEFPVDLASLQDELLDLDGALDRLKEKPVSNKYMVNLTQLREGNDNKRQRKEPIESVSLGDGTRLERDAEGHLVVCYADKRINVNPKYKGNRPKGDRNRPILRDRRFRNQVRNPKTEQFVARKLDEAKEKGVELTRDQVLNDLVCHRCNGKGHIKADCRKEVGDDRQGHNKENQTPNKNAKKNKAYNTIVKKCDSDVPIYSGEETNNDDDDDEPRRSYRGFFHD